MDFTALKNFMDHLTAWRIPGNSISVRIKGKEVFRYCSGYSNLEEQIPMAENLLFNIYSCSKVATVTAALQLYEKGMFLLDDPVYAYIPAFKQMSIKGSDGSIREAKNPITIRHLFTMTSGLNYDKQVPAFSKAHRLTDGKMDTLAVMKCLASEPLDFEPGSKWQYSFSHDLLAAVVETISGQKFRDYMRQNIFEPLGMNETTYHPTTHDRNRLAEQYRFVDSAEDDLVKLQSVGAQSRNGGSIVNANKTCSFTFGEEYDSGGAGIITSVEDYSKFCSALANGGKGILSQGTIELMRTNQLSSTLLPHLNWPQLKGYGYGLGVRTLIDKAASGTTGSIGEFGWGGAAGATVLVDPELNLSMFYTHHMLNPQEGYYQPRLRNVLYACVTK